MCVGFGAAPAQRRRLAGDGDGDGGHRCGRRSRGDVRGVRPLGTAETAAGVMGRPQSPWGCPGAEGLSGASGMRGVPGGVAGTGRAAWGPTGVQASRILGPVGWEGMAVHLTRAARTRETWTRVIAAIPRPSALGGDAPGWPQL